jgi:hypothetical protein
MTTIVLLPQASNDGKCEERLHASKLLHLLHLLHMLHQYPTTKNVNAGNNFLCIGNCCRRLRMHTIMQFHDIDGIVQMQNVSEETYDAHHKTLGPLTRLNGNKNQHHYNLIWQCKHNRSEFPQCKLRVEDVFEEGLYTVLSGTVDSGMQEHNHTVFVDPKNRSKNKPGHRSASPGQGIPAGKLTQNPTLWPEALVQQVVEAFGTRNHEGLESAALRDAAKAVQFQHWDDSASWPNGILELIRNYCNIIRNIIFMQKVDRWRVPTNHCYGSGAPPYDFLILYVIFNSMFCASFSEKRLELKSLKGQTKAEGVGDPVPERGGELGDHRERGGMARPRHWPPLAAPCLATDRAPALPTMAPGPSAASRST